MSVKRESVVLKGIKKAYRSPDGDHTLPVLHDINLVLYRGETAAIVGPSGAGKSTLLNIIGGLDYPDAGTLEVAGTDPNTLKRDALSRFRNTKIGFIFQLHHLLPQCTVLENVLLPTLMYPDHDKAYYLDAAHHLLETVGLQDRMHHKPAHISVGECQRTAVARALIKEPEVILADEPTGSLDAKNAHTIACLIRELDSEKKITTIMVTHAQKIADVMEKTFYLENGVLRAR